jgi:hypothetical protein
MSIGYWLQTDRGYIGEVVRLVMWLRLQNLRYWAPLLAVLIVGSAIPADTVRKTVWGAYGTATVGLLVWAGYNRFNGGTWPELSGKEYGHGPRWELPKLHREVTSNFDRPSTRQSNANNSSHSSTKICWNCGGRGYTEFTHSNCTDEGTEEWIETYSCNTCGGTGYLKN